MTIRGTRWIVTVLLFMATVAAAQSNADVERAKKLFDAGKQAYSAEQYAVATAAFEEAYRLSQLPAILFSAAQSNRRQYLVDRDPRSLRRAVELYRLYAAEVQTEGRHDDAVQFLADLEPILARADADQTGSAAGSGVVAPPAAAPATRLMVTTSVPSTLASIDGGVPSDAPLIRNVTPGKHRVRGEAPGYFADERDALAVEGGLVVVEVTPREMPGRVRVHGPAGARIVVDGRTVGMTPLGAPLELTSGRHVLTVIDRGAYPWVREIVLGRGEEITLTASLEPTAQRRMANAFMAAGGLLVVGGWATAAAAIGAQNDARDILAKRDKENIDDADVSTYDDARARRDTYATASTFLFGTAAILGAAGTLAYFLDTPRVEGLAGGAIVPIAPGGGVGLSWIQAY